MLIADATMDDGTHGQRQLHRKPGPVQIAADVFNLRLDRVTRETSPDTVRNWDSVQQLNFVLALEASAGISA